MIRFGTAGWRGIISDEFTFLNVRKVAHSISAYIKENQDYGVASSEYRAFIGDGNSARPPVPLVVIGYDGRFLSEEFAHEIAGVFALDGIKALIADSDLPTPAVGWSIVNRRAVGGVMITASHNPAQYNGFKWMPYWGGAATPNITDDIERRIELLGQHAVKTMSVDRSVRENWIETVDLKPAYLKQLASLLDLKA